MAKRQIVIDTETTGLKPEDEHKIIEIGGVEIIDRMVTNNNFHQYINPERKIEKDALRVHGITNEFLLDKPIFADIVDAFLEYVVGAELIAHNAPFDIGFIKHEIKLLSRTIKFKPLAVIDTLQLSRKLHPGQRHNLDALCKRYKIDNTKRKLHGALLDATLLAEAYLRMTGGQATLFDEGGDEGEGGEDGGSIGGASQFVSMSISQKSSKNRKPLPVIYATDEELAAHQAYLANIGKQSGKCVWEDDD